MALLPYILTLSLMFIMSLPFSVDSADRAHAHVTVIQPNISAIESVRALWSISARKQVENRLDALTRSAIENSDDLIVWPEGGNGLINMRLPKRREKIRQLLDGSGAELLVVGPDLSPTGQFTTAVHLVDSAGYIGSSFKSRPVPFSEEHLLPGPAQVLNSKEGKVGITVCFDALFESVVIPLASNGSDFLIASANDSSFFGGTLTQRHLGHALLRGIEVGRSVLFFTNDGPILATNVEGEIVYEKNPQSKTGFHRVSLEKSDLTTLFSRGGRFVPLTVSVWFLILLANGHFRRNYPAGNCTNAVFFSRNFNGLHFLFTISSLLLVTLLEVQAISKRNSSSVWTTLDQLVQRSSRPQVLDNIAPLFKQESENLCGAAAIAYLLTILGDTVFPSQIVKKTPLTNTDGYSLNELAIIARKEGFNATGYRSTWDDLPTLESSPVIAHVADNHYVVVISVAGSHVRLFDPIEGYVRIMHREEFEEYWRGIVLEIATMPITAKSALTT